MEIVFFTGLLHLAGLPQMTASLLASVHCHTISFNFATCVKSVNL